MQLGSKNDKQPSLCDKNTPNEAEKEKFKIQNSRFKIVIPSERSDEGSTTVPWLLYVGIRKIPPLSRSE